MLYFFNPLEQFEIKNVFIFHLYCKCPVFDISITNSAIMLFLILMAYYSWNIRTMRIATIIPGRWQWLIESLYIFILEMLGQQNTKLFSIRFFPYIYTLFLLIFFSNIFGLFPYTFTITSHICITFILAFITFFSITLIGLYLNKFNFIKFFIPSGIPIFLLPFLFIIEIISYFIRPFSLSIRLFANMLAGHTLLYILSNFCVTIWLSQLDVSIMFILSILILSFVFILEIAIAFIQSYVFIILTCIYLNDIFNVNSH